MFIKEIISTPWFRIVSLGFLLAIVLLILFGPAKLSDQDHSIVVSGDNLAHLVVGWQKTWQRSPTQEELQGLVRSHVRDEVLYREAVSRGMAESNEAVRRALIMQMNMLAESQVEQSRLTEKEVQSFYNLRKDQFRQAPTISFRQVYFKEESLAGLSEEDLQEIIDQLNRNPDDYEEFGDGIMLQPSYTLQTQDYVSSQFGKEFSRQIFEVEGTGWTGPIISGFGSHLVQVTEKTEAIDAPLEQVWDEVVNELLYEEKQAAKEQFYTELLRQYNVSYQGLAKQLDQND